MRRIGEIKLFDRVQIIDNTAFYSGVVGIVVGQNAEGELLVEFFNGQDTYASCWIPEELCIPVVNRLKAVSS